MASNTAAGAATENFADLLEESLRTSSGFDGRVTTGRVISIEGDFAIIDVGLKAEGRVQLKEFATAGKAAEIKVGDFVDVFVERMEDKNGEAMLSREKAKREEAWGLLEKSYSTNARVNGVIFGRVKGGFTVDLGGAVAFLPGSQVDIRPVRDVTPLMGTPQPFQILKMDRSRGNIVVSRRAVLEESRAEQRAEIVGNMAEGERRKGVVKNITDYGAFVDLGGIDGLLHVTDMSWKRVSHPSQVVEVGQEVDVQIIKINPDTQRISLGMKQLMTDPWDGVAAKYPVGAKLSGRVTNITDYGAFVELEDGVEGLIHVSEMSWTKKNVHPGKIISSSQEVDVMVLDVDADKRRISLGLKQVMHNPWEAFQAEHPIGTNIEGEVRGITEFGLFVGLGPDLDGMVHINDIDWNLAGEEAVKKYNKGDTVSARVLDIDIEKERISLGIKQLSQDPTETIDLRKNSIVTTTVVEITTGGIEVSIADGAMKAFIRKADLARDRGDQRPERFAVGDKVDALVTAFDKAGRKVSLSIKAMEIKDEKEAVEQYGSADSGASLGDILGAALKGAKKDEE